MRFGAYATAKVLETFEYSALLGVDPLGLQAAAFPPGYSFFARATKLLVMRLYSIGFQEEAAFNATLWRFGVIGAELWLVLSYLQGIEPWEFRRTRSFRGQALARIYSASVALRQRTYPAANPLAELPQQDVIGADRSDEPLGYMMWLMGMVLWDRTLGRGRKKKKEETAGMPLRMALGALHIARVATVVATLFEVIDLLGGSNIRGAQWSEISTTACLGAIGATYGIHPSKLEAALLSQLSEWRHLPADAAPPRILTALVDDTGKTLFNEQKDIRNDAEFLEHTGEIVTFLTVLYALRFPNLDRREVWSSADHIADLAFLEAKNIPRSSMDMRTGHWGDWRRGYSSCEFNRSDPTEWARRLNERNESWRPVEGQMCGIGRDANLALAQQQETAWAWAALSPDTVVQNIFEDMHQSLLTRIVFPKWDAYLQKHRATAAPLFQQFVANAEPSVRTFLHYTSRTVRPPADFVFARCCGQATNVTMAAVVRLDTRLARLLPLLKNSEEPEQFARKHLVSYVAANGRPGFFTEWATSEPVQRPFHVLERADVDQAQLRWTRAEESALWYKHRKPEPPPPVNPASGSTRTTVAGASFIAAGLGMLGAAYVVLQTSASNAALALMSAASVAKHKAIDRFFE